jgi:peptidyl-prolyl cis-trans isomerase C
MIKFINTLAMSAACLLVAVNTTTNAQTTPSDGQSAAPEPTVVATVNGKPITMLQVQKYAAQQAARGQQAPPPAVLQELIQLELLGMEAERLKLDEQPAVAAELERQRTAVLANNMIRTKFESVEVSEAQLKEAYQAHLDSLPKNEYKARHILLENKEQAVEVIQSLEDGADFAELAKEKSTGPSGPKGGDLGWFGLDSMVPAFGDALGKMSAGESSQEPVETKFGWHVIKLEETRDVPEPAFEDMKRDLQNKVLNSRLQAYLQELTDAAKIEIKNPPQQAPQ